MDAKIKVIEDGISTLIWRISEPTVAEQIWEEGQVLINTKEEKNFQVKIFNNKYFYSFELLFNQLKI